MTQQKMADVALDIFCSMKKNIGFNMEGTILARV
jgi:hypothetical protein